MICDTFTTMFTTYQEGKLMNLDSFTPYLPALYQLGSGSSVVPQGGAKDGCGKL